MSANQMFNQPANENIDGLEQNKKFNEFGLKLTQNVGEARDILNEIGCATSESTDLDWKAGVFRAALNEARTIGENGRKSGFEFIQEMENALTTLVKENRLTFMGSLELSTCWHTSGLVPPESLSSTNDDFTKFFESDSTLNQELVQNLLDYTQDRMPVENKDNPRVLYESLLKVLPSVPDSTKYDFVRTAVGMPEERFANLGCSLLFVNNDTIRSASIDGLIDRLNTGRLTSAILTKLTLIRSWMNDSGTISRLDQLVRDSMKKGFEIKNSDKKFKHRSAYASTVDGSGTQYIIVSTKIGNSHNLAMMLLKQGFGVKDAYQLPCQNKRQQVERIEQLKTGIAPIESYEVPIEYVRQAVASALHQGSQKKVTPPPGLIDCVDLLGLLDMRPEGGEVSDILAKIDPEGKIINLEDGKLEELVEKSKFWPEKFSTLLHWFESNDSSNDILMSDEPDEVKWQRLYTSLNSRREFWSSCIVRMAMLLSSVKNESANEFVAVAAAMERNWDLEKIPVFETIILQTIRSWEYETGMAVSTGGMPHPTAETSVAAPSDSSYELNIEMLEPVRRELKRHLASANYEMDWLEGYFAGLCTAPTQIKITSCVADFLERFQMNTLDVQETEKALNLMLMVHNFIMLKLMKGLVSEVLPSGDRKLSVWASGYLSAWNDFPKVWLSEQKVQIGRELRASLELAAKNASNAADFRKKFTKWIEFQVNTRWS